MIFFFFFLVFCENEATARPAPQQRAVKVWRKSEGNANSIFRDYLFNSHENLLFYHRRRPPSLGEKLNEIDQRYASNNSIITEIENSKKIERIQSYGREEHNGTKFTRRKQRKRPKKRKTRKAQVLHSIFHSNFQ